MTAPEARIKTEIRKYLSSQGIFWSSVQNGFGAKPGDPDIIICLDGRFVAIEVKTPEGRQSDIQKQREKEIRDSGGAYFVVRSLDEVKMLKSRAFHGTWPVKTFNE